MAKVVNKVTKKELLEAQLAFSKGLQVSIKYLAQVTGMSTKQVRGRVRMYGLGTNDHGYVLVA